MPDTTLAAVLVDPAAPLALMELGLPELAPGQVLVDVAWSGVCGSQLLEARGRKGPDRYLPHTLGHEGAGTVLAVGAGVTKVQPGQRVVMSWIKGDGAEVPGTRYEGPTGAVNSGAISTFLTRGVTCENRVTPIPDAMPLREAALLGCAAPTGAGIVLNTARPEPGSSIAIFGAGGIGLSAVLGAKLAEASRILVVDVVPEKLAQARALGATDGIDARQDDPVAAIRELTGGGADVAIEAAGRRETMESALAAVRDGGGLCVLAGNLPYGERISVDPYDLIRGKRLVGTWGGESRPDRDIQRYVDHYLQGRLDLAALISREYPLTRVNEALADLEQGRVLRALLDNHRGVEA